MKAARGDADVHGRQPPSARGERSWATQPAMATIAGIARERLERPATTSQFQRRGPCSDFAHSPGRSMAATRLTNRRRGGALRPAIPGSVPLAIG